MDAIGLVLAFGVWLSGATGTAEYCDQNSYSTLPAGAFDTTEVAEMGGGTHKRHAYRIASLDQFVTTCPIQAINSQFDPKCATEHAAAIVTDGDLILLDRHDKNGVPHLHVWKGGVESLDVELSGVVRSQGRIVALSGAKMFADYVARIFVYIVPDAQMDGAKYYAIEEFYGDECSDERPDTSVKVVKRPAGSDWVALHSAKENVMKQRGKRLAKSGEGQGNTSGGGEPDHHP